MGDRRWSFLENNPAVSYPGWIPPEEECEDFVDLRETHQRLLAARDGALEQHAALQRRQERQTEEHGRAITDALLAGQNAPPPPKGEVTEKELADAWVWVEATNDALQEFARKAVETVAERAPEVEAKLAGRLRLADEKRAEARALLAEADKLAAEPARLRAWIARATGESSLGLIPFDQLGLPERLPVPEVFEEIAGLHPFGVMEVGSDDISGEVEVMSHAG